jgi:hypothetical protein
MKRVLFVLAVLIVVGLAVGYFAPGARCHRAWDAMARTSIGVGALGGGPVDIRIAVDYFLRQQCAGGACAYLQQCLTRGWRP